MGRTWRARMALAAVVASAALIAAGCEADVTKEILFVNDSVTHEAIVQVVNEMNAVAKNGDAGRYAPNFGSSVPGIGLRNVPGLTPEEVDAYWPAHLSSVLDHVDPEVLLVELGYNDCGYDLSDYGTDIDEFMAVVPSSLPVLWVTMADARGRHSCDETINAALEEATTRWTNLSLLDLATHLAGHAEWVDADSRHLSEAGKGEYARWLHGELDARFLEPDPPPETDPPPVTDPPVEPTDPPVEP